MTELDQLTLALAARFIELFNIVLKDPLQAGKTSPDSVPLQAPFYCARIPLKGQGVDGWLLMETDQKFLSETHPEKKYGTRLDSTDYLDWAGEILNRTLAGSKPELKRQGWILNLGLPIANEGQPPVMEAPKLQQSLVLESGPFYVKFTFFMQELSRQTLNAS